MHNIHLLGCRCPRRQHWVDEHLSASSLVRQALSNAEGGYRLRCRVVFECTTGLAIATRVRSLYSRRPIISCRKLTTTKWAPSKYRPAARGLKLRAASSCPSSPNTFAVPSMELLLCHSLPGESSRLCLPFSLLVRAFCVSGVIPSAARCVRDSPSQNLDLVKPWARPLCSSSQRLRAQVLRPIHSQSTRL